MTWLKVMSVAVARGRPGRDQRTLGEPRQLLDEVGIASRFAGDHLGPGLGRGLVCGQEGAGQLLRLPGRELSEHDVASFQGRTHVLAQGEDGPQQRARVHLLAPVAPDEEKGGRIGRTKKRLQESGAVGVAPLHVVDEEDEPLAVGQAHEQLAQRPEGAAAQLE